MLREYLREPYNSYTRNEWLLVGICTGMILITIFRIGGVL